MVVEGAKEGAPVKVILVTGFLGSGKTTFVGEILGSRPEWVAVVNDLAEYNVDSDIVSRRRCDRARVDTVRLQNGCLCCTVKDDLVEGLSSLLADDSVTSLVIETSGVSDPLPLCQALRSPRLRRCRLDTVVTLVDASDDDVLERMGDSAAMKNQVRAADVVLLNKADLATEEQIENARRRVEEIRGGGRTLALVCVRAKISLSLVLDVPGGEGGPEDRRRNLARASAMWSPASSNGIGGGHGTMTSLTFTHGGSPPLSLWKFHAFLANLPGTVLRGKGFARFCAATGRRFEFHLVGRRYEAKEIEGDGAGRERRREGEDDDIVVVLIGTAMDKEDLNRGLRDCLRHEDCFHCGTGGGGTTAGGGEDFRAMLAKDGRFSLLESPWANAVTFTLKGTYGSFGALDATLVEAANRELAVRLSQYGLYVLSSGGALTVDYEGADVGRWETALGKETFVVLSNLIDPQAQNMYLGI